MANEIITPAEFDELILEVLRDEEAAQLEIERMAGEGCPNEPE